MYQAKNTSREKHPLAIFSNAPDSGHLDSDIFSFASTEVRLERSLEDAAHSSGSIHSVDDLNDHEFFTALQQIAQSRRNLLAVAIEKGWSERSRKRIICRYPQIYLNLMDALLLDDEQPDLFMQLVSYQDEDIQPIIEFFIGKSIRIALESDDLEKQKKILKKLTDAKLIKKQQLDIQKKIFLNRQKSRTNFLRYYISQGAEELQEVLEGYKDMKNNEHDANTLKDLLEGVDFSDQSIETIQSLLEQSIRKDDCSMVEAILKSQPTLTDYAYTVVSGLPESSRVSLVMARYLDPNDLRKLALLEKVVRRGDIADIDEMLVLSEDTEFVKNMLSTLNQLIKYLVHSPSLIEVEMVKKLLKKLLEHKYKLHEKHQQHEDLSLFDAELKLDDIIGVALSKKVDSDIILAFLEAHPKAAYSDKDSLIRDINLAVQHQAAAIRNKLLTYAGEEDLKNSPEIAGKLSDLVDAPEFDTFRKILKIQGIDLEKKGSADPGKQPDSPETLGDEPHSSLETQQTERWRITEIMISFCQRCLQFFNSWRGLNAQEIMGNDKVAAPEETPPSLPIPLKAQPASWWGRGLFFVVAPAAAPHVDPLDKPIEPSLSRLSSPLY